MFCSFCGTHQSDCEGGFFEGPSAAICGDCVLMALRVILKGWEKGEPANVVEGEAARPKPPAVIPGPADPDWGSTYGTPLR